LRSGAAALVILLAVSACGSGGSPPRERDGGIAVEGVDGRTTIYRAGFDSNAIYLEGMDLKSKGDCAGAAPKLRMVASRGPGYENAQTALGECLTQNAPADKQPSAEFQEGMTWLRRAGDAGWAEAQAALARAHALGPPAVHSGEEAAYWLALYEANNAKARIGFRPMAAADIAAVEKSLTDAEKAVGAQRAALWQRKVWLPPPQPDRPAENQRRGRRTAR